MSPIFCQTIARFAKALIRTNRVSAALVTSTLLIFQLTFINVNARISIFCKSIAFPTTAGYIGGVAIIAAYVFTATIVYGAGLHEVAVVCCNRWCK